jgi:Xaa-Pro aminopeptidase
VTVQTRQRLRPSKERQRYLPTLSLEERDRRWALVRQMMTYEGLDCLVLVGNDLSYDFGMANYRYVTHIGSKLGGYCVFPIEGDPIVLQGLPHMVLPFNIYEHTQDWVTDIRVNTGMRGAVDAVRELGFERGSVGLVGFGMTIWGRNVSQTDHALLHESLPQSRIVDVTSRVDQIRAIKSDEEIEMLRRAGALAQKMVHVMRDNARPGVLESTLFADMLHAAVSEGGEVTPFNLLMSGPIHGDPTEATEHLLHGSELPAAPSTRPLAEGDLVVTELHSSYGGYLAAAEFSVVLGKAPDELRRIHEVAIECYQGTLSKLRAGNTFGEAIEATRAPCEAAGFDYVELGMHGHGLASPEVPTCVYKQGAPMIAGRGLWDVELQHNMVFGNNIDVFDPAWRPDIGIMFGDMVRVTDDGPEPLVNVPLELPEITV